MYHQLENTTSCDDMANTIHSMVEEYETGIFLQLRDHLPNHQRDHLVDTSRARPLPHPTTSQTTTPTATTTCHDPPPHTTTQHYHRQHRLKRATVADPRLRHRDRSTTAPRSAIREFAARRSRRTCVGASVDTAECTGAATVLNEMADAYVGGGFQACEATTPTTTVTTSVTTTPIVAAFECVANYGTFSPG